MRFFKIKYPEFGSPAIIRKPGRKNKKLADLYCTCLEVQCGHTFVFNALFSYTLGPSGLMGNKLVKCLIDQLKPKERQFALKLLSGHNSYPRPR
ncbi:TPA: ogr/Delta-like zinc finger family protein [Enterobacter cancerogenus]